MIKVIVASIVAGVLFPLLTKVFMSFKKDSEKSINYPLQGVLFAVIMFIMLLIVQPFN
ncbi:hypothetical protein LCM14_26665 [Priestia aryabhattai]|uniref:hypothetical protein n=1 Tax=Priestia TaxID=2800373 RepID=UPI001CD59FF5|nr:hypothetical protein [Priestia aryabhattai]MCA1053343.1 hypothetical protein [Priestia aryabhattai]